MVKRHLIDAGFRLERKPSKGKKKEVLFARFQTSKPSGKAYQQRPVNAKPQHVTIVGGGIASACAAYSLCQKGIRVTLLCQDKEVAQGASSNAIGALYPLLHQQKDDISLFFEKAFWRAKEFYQEVYQQGFYFDHNWCGLLELSYKDALIKRQQKFAEIMPWSNELIYSANQQEASEIAGLSLVLGGLFMPAAGWVAPQQLVSQLFNAAKSTNNLRTKTNCNISKITQLEDGKWQLNSNKGNHTATNLVLAGGADAIELNFIKQTPVYAVRGQVSRMEANEQSSNYQR